MDDRPGVQDAVPAEGERGPLAAGQVDVDGIGLVQAVGHFVLLHVGPAARRLCQARLQVGAERRHREAARVRLLVGPLQVADAGLLAPAVRAANGRGGLDHRGVLHRGPGVPAVAPVLALPPVEPGVAVDGARAALVLVRGGRPGAVGLVGDGPEHRRVAAAGVVGAAVADQVDRAVLGDAPGGERAGQVRPPAEDHAHHVGARTGHRVVDDHALDRSPGALPVAVVGAPAGHLVDGAALGLERGHQPVRAERCRHASPPITAGRSRSRCPAVRGLLPRRGRPTRTGPAGVVR